MPRKATTPAAKPKKARADEPRPKHNDGDVDPEKVARLRKQIAEGRFTVDARATAEKMLPDLAEEKKKK